MLSVPPFDSLNTLQVDAYQRGGLLHCSLRLLREEVKLKLSDITGARCCTVAISQKLTFTMAYLLNTTMLNTTDVVYYDV
jgi:heterodisulfide reductase subunit B